MIFVQSAAIQSRTVDAGLKTSRRKIVGQGNSETHRSAWARINKGARNKKPVKLGDQVFESISAVARHLRLNNGATDLRKHFKLGHYNGTPLSYVKREIPE